jgi:lipoyl(octanoyl) transferase
MVCTVVDLGLMRYGDALALQRTLSALRADRLVGDILLLLQHPPVVTLGRGGRKDQLLVPESALAQLAIGFVEVERGGGMTYHGPGQLVGYPILDLTERGRDLHRYLRGLEEALIGTVGALGIEAARRTGRTGVWVRDRKIASIGIHVGRWVTRHGFALNVDMDLTPFELILPCGLHGGVMTSLANELGRPLAFDDVVPVLLDRFATALDVTLVPSRALTRRRGLRPREHVPAGRRPPVTPAASSDPSDQSAGATPRNIFVDMPRAAL